jgi:hypothetical protein
MRTSVSHRGDNHVTVYKRGCANLGSSLNNVFAKIYFEIFYLTILFSVQARQVNILY